MNDGSSGYSVAVLIAVLFLLLLPILVIASRGRLPLQIAALLLCALGIAALFGATAGASISGLSLIVTLPAAAGLWFAGLFCALAAWSDAAHERRMKELTVRLLMNDPRGLGNPEDYRKSWFG
jgi:hypothetical protein